MQNCFEFWIRQYEEQYFVRFSIVDKMSLKAIGTIEIFEKKDTLGESCKVGLLRIDLASKYEKEEFIRELLVVIVDNFYYEFELENIITKAIPYAKQRVTALNNEVFIELDNNTIVTYDSYFIKSKSM